MFRDTLLIFHGLSLIFRGTLLIFHYKRTGPFDSGLCREYFEYYRKEEFPMGDSKSQNNFEEKDRLNEQQRREQEAMKDKAREPNEQNRMINTADNQKR